MRRVDEAVRQVVSDAVAHDLKDPRIGFVTVTEVKTSPDLRRARVYVSVLGDRKARTASLAGLESAHGFLQKRLSQQLRLKHTPELQFVLDETSATAFRLERLIDRELGDAE
ncbi:MAG: 30S ribosome-binding factor RbfA [Solirubrobacteraceae bacterium]|nr:30S ribosome-binding factor RbfA [Solirubrobacteraceae bacterium]